MWYQGWQSSSASIGYATASVEDTGTALEDTPTGLPDRFTLHQNYPNPFNPSTTIRYEVHRPGHLILAIYNVLGQRVRTLVDAQQAAGERSVVWDGRNDQGEVMASGVYFSRMQVADVVENRTMLLVK